MTVRIASAVLVILIAAVTTNAQLGQVGGQLGKARDALQKANKPVQDLAFTEAEEQQLGADVSARLRERFGVVQDAAIHRYVTLAGTLVASESSRADLPWTFIVLDTDGVNAFAAPGGFIHITRGALALIRNEAELVGVLAHEVGHVTARHTIRAIQKTKVEGALAKSASRSAFLQGIGDRLYGLTLENAFDRGDELEADRIAAPLANHAGYSAGGLGSFLSRLAERNAGLKERSGVFASHPESQARTNALTKIITSQGLTSAALGQARYASSVTYPPVALSQLTAAGPAEAGATPAAPARTGGSGTFGLGGMTALGRERSGSSTVASAGSRGVNPDRDARGGPNKALVVVTVSADDVARFRRGIA